MLQNHYIRDSSQGVCFLRLILSQVSSANAHNLQFFFSTCLIVKIAFPVNFIVRGKEN